MLDYLQSIFGAKINISKWELPSNAPYFIRDGYSFQTLAWGKQTCLFAKPNDSSIRLPTLKKQFGIISALSAYPSALELEGLTSKQRQNLIDSHIPFVYAPHQAYLPFWGCAFTEKYGNVVIAEGGMTPATQFIFLHLFYTLNLRQTTAAKIAKELGLIKVTVARAIDDLVSAELFTISIQGRRKWISASMDSALLLRKAMMRMKSPIEKHAFLRSMPPDTHYMLGGLRALSQLSMVSAGNLDGSIVFYKKDFTNIKSEFLIDEKTFNDFGGYAAEVWNYNPKPLSQRDTVDDISLLLSLMSSTDERVQMGLDEIRKKYGLPIDSQE
jgi:hypothetical protein